MKHHKKCFARDWMNVGDEQFNWTNTTKLVYHVHTLKVTESVYGEKLEGNKGKWKSRSANTKTRKRH